MTDERFVSYKSLIYKANLTKYETYVGTIAAHKPCKFQKYQLTKSPLWGEKFAKISYLGGGVSDRKSPNMG